MLPVFKNSAAAIRDLAFSEHNWHDYEAHGRSVRSGDYLLVRNFRPSLAWQGPADSVRSPSHRNLLALQEAGKLSAAQADVFLAPRPAVELYNVRQDPHQLMNLAGEAESIQIEQRLSELIDQWMQETGDSIPDRLSPDTFHRTSGKAIPKADLPKGPYITPGEDRHADRINHPGPR